MAARKPTRWDVAREARLLPRRTLTAAAAAVVAGVLLLTAGRPAVAVLGLAILVAAAFAFSRGAWAALAAIVALAAAACVAVVRYDVAGLGQLAVVAGALGCSAAGGWWTWDRLLRPLDSRRRNQRGREHSNHNGGTASVWDIGQFGSAWAMRAKARIIRPSLAALSSRQLRGLDPSAYSVLVARTGYSLGPVSGEVEVRSSLEDVTMRTGGPRSGKSQELATHILDAPGAVLCTSTRLDLLEITGRDRAKVGDVLVFNPSALGLLPSTVRWTPLAGCEDFPTAQRRSESMIPERSGEAAHWSEQASALFAILLHAGARAGHQLQMVADWVADLPGHQDEIIAALAKAPNAGNLVSRLKHFAGTNSKTLTSQTASIGPALQWLSNPACAHVGDAPLNDPGLWDAAQFVRGTDTIYLLGEPGGFVSSLISALTAEIAHQLRMVASLQPSGRLDPPVAMVLDEMALACPQIPIEDWTADMGGRGVTIHIAIQSLAQLRKGWGKDAAATILNNVTTLIVFGGTKDPEDLATISGLSGQRLEELDPDDRRYTVLLDPATISQLGTAGVAVFGRGMRPVLGNAPQAWQRQPVRRDLAYRIGYWIRYWLHPLFRTTKAPVVEDDRTKLEVGQ